MPLMSWTSHLSVHVQAIDEDHQRLIEMANRLYDAMLARNEGEILHSLFADLADYTETHFHREESFFETTAYPLTELHKQEHARMIEWVQQARGRLEQKEPGALPAELLEYFKNWLFHHIGAIDKKMAPYLRPTDPL